MARSRNYGMAWLRMLNWDSAEPRFDDCPKAATEAFDAADEKDVLAIYAKKMTDVDDPDIGYDCIAAGDYDFINRVAWRPYAEEHNLMLLAIKCERGGDYTGPSTVISDTYDLRHAANQDILNGNGTGLLEVCEECQTLPDTCYCCDRAAEDDESSNDTDGESNTTVADEMDAILNAKF